MPPCDYSKYPKYWKTKIRPEILQRAEKYCERIDKILPCCENCGVENRAIGWRDDDGNFIHCTTYEEVTKRGFGFYQTSGYLRIILTISHLDHNTENNDYSNLKALCQRCHLKHNKEFHSVNRKEAIKKKKGLQELF